MAKSTDLYELTYILNGALSDEQTKTLVQRVSKYVNDNGGDIVEVDEWGTRRLAYPIKKKRNGYYVNMYFRASGELIGRLERALEIEDDVLRYLTLSMDAKMVRAYEERKQGIKRAAAEAAARSEQEEEDED